MRIVPGWLVVAVGLLTPGSSVSSDTPAAQPVPARQPTIVFMTDFGTANDAAAICRAVIAGIAPEARIMDITHQVTPFSIEEGARDLESVTPFYPAGTVFLVVVDPGVGTARKALIVRTRRHQYFVLPDNGLATPVVDRATLDRGREITNPGWMIGERVSSTFHGRDVFSPTAAHLAAGWDWTQAGPVVSELVRLQPRLATLGPRGIDGEVIGLDDPYGNVITDIGEADFAKLGYAIGDRVAVRIDGRRRVFPFVRTFGDVPPGWPLLYIDSRGRVALAVNERNLSRTWDILPPATISIARRGGRRAGAGR